ncbi:MAG: PIG-L deacetylase family protein [Syntrophomonadaceae bacterium]|nr:PIG-L deacetylase family protein [Syntrophomonadaceae bacterium]
MKRVMVFAPHPDDDILGCGGSMARHTARGDAVRVVYCCSGENGSPEHGPQELSAIRRAEAQRAVALVGAEVCAFLSLQDGFFTADAAVSEDILRLLRRERPHIIYVPHAGENNRDHQLCHRMVTEAVGRAAGPWFKAQGPAWRVERILAYEVWTPLPSPGLYRDISPWMEQKLAALRQHRSQLKYMAYDDAVRGLNRYRAVGSGLGCEYCECFQVLRLTEEGEDRR